MITTDIRDAFGKKVCVASISPNYTVLNFKNVKNATLSLEDLHDQIDKAIHKEYTDE